MLGTMGSAVCEVGNAYMPEETSVEYTGWLSA